LEKITSKTYDVSILSKPIQHQIDTYYFPKSQENRRRVKLILDYLEPEKGDKIIDIGCGVGTFAFHSAKAGAQAYGINYSWESIKLAVALTKHFNVNIRTQFIVARVDDIPFNDSYFDKIVAADIIELLSDSDKESMMKELCRVVKDDGFIVIFTPNKIRDRIGLLWKRITFQKISQWDVTAHFGLISKMRYEKILKRNRMTFQFQYIDIVRPYLAKIPFARNLLSLNLLWIARKPNHFGDIRRNNKGCG
jgi:ubiquinone/menaquinone biosynthesis C-methylase UbiE